MKYFVRAHTRNGMSYVNKGPKGIFLSKKQDDATLFSSKAKAQAVADHLNKDAYGISANVETVWWEEPKRNPAPSPAKRSAKFHRIRRGFVAKLKSAVRRADMDEQALWGRKLLKLDRMFYAPRNVKRRPPKSNPAPSYKSRAARLIALAEKIDAEKKRLWNSIGGGKVKRLTSAMYYSKKWEPWRKLNEKTVRLSDMLMREAAKENKRRTR